MSLLLSGAHVVTMDDAGSEHADGWVLVADGRVEAVGGGAPPEADERVDLGGAVVTPGLVNTHHHLYQTLTRARAQEADLFTWLKTLYPVWAGIDEESVYAAARTGLAELALSGCTTVFDHHYVFPRGTSGLIEAEVRAARELGVRIVASRGSMDLGESDGGLPPDSLVESLDDVLADTERLVELAGRRLRADRGRAVLAVLRHGRADARVRASSRAGSGSCCTRISPRPSRRRRIAASSTAARPSSTSTRSAGSTATSGARTASISHNPTSARFADTGTGAAHCPTSNLRLGAGVAPVRDLLDAGVRVGLGVDGSASNERGDLLLEVKQALLVARGRGGPAALTVRDALRLGTRGGAAVLGRDDIGSLEPGKRADIAVWRTDGLELAGAADLVAGLVLSAPHRVDRLYVGGEEVVRDGRLVRADEEEIARHHRAQARRFAP